MDMYVVRMETTTYAAQVAKAVTAAIEAAGQTQLGISEATSIPRTTLIRRLSGATPFTVAELDAIADALGVSVTAFLTSDEHAA
jgi:transcriptional regulator with XRE-family HTH domain